MYVGRQNITEESLIDLIIPQETKAPIHNINISKENTEQLGELIL